MLAIEARERGVRCPVCGEALRVGGAAGGRWWSCPAGHGRAANVSVVRQMGGQAAVKTVFGELALGRATPGRPCPSCSAAMSVVDVPTPSTAGAAPSTGARVPVDICSRCQLLWFDPAEAKAVVGTGAPAPAEDAIDRALHPDAIRAIAAMRASRVRADVERTWSELDRPMTGADSVLSFFGVPIESDADSGRTPWFTWGLAVAMAMGSVAAWAGWDAAIVRFGVWPGAPFGRTFVALWSHAFVHVVPELLFLHFLVLVALGRALERRAGWAFLAVCFFGASVLSGLTYWLAGSDHLGLVGSEAGVASIAAACILICPKARLTWELRSRWRWTAPYFLGTSVWVVAAIWLVLTGLMGVASVGATEDVAEPSPLALTAGIAFGAGHTFARAFWRGTHGKRRRPRSAPSQTSRSRG